MSHQSFEHFVVIRKPCPKPTCLWGRHYHHFVEDYYVCNCGWKKAGDFFIPEIYEGDDWDDEKQDFIQGTDDIINED